MTTRKRMIVKPYFKLRISSKGRKEKASVLCLIRMPKLKDSIPFTTGVKTLPENFKDQRISLNDVQSRTDNQTLDRIYLEINDLAKTLHYQEKKITPTILKELYCEKPQKIPSFVETMDLMIKSRQVEESTLKQYQSLRKNIIDYLQDRQKINVELDQFKNRDWQNMKKENVRNDASNHVLLTFIKSVYKFAMKNGFIIYHEIINQENPVGKEKELIWLDPEHLERLINHRYLFQHHENVRKAFIFQCFTGLAYEEIRTFKKSVNIKGISKNYFQSILNIYLLVKQRFMCYLMV